MEALLDDLRGLLAKQVDNLKILEEVLGRQRSCLVGRDVPGIIESIGEQEEHLQRIQQMEEERGRLLSAMAPHLGSSSGSLTIRELSRSVDPEVGEELRAMGSVIRETLERVGRVNRENKTLIEHSLDFVQEMLQAITGQGLGNPTYEESGAMKTRSQERMLVNRVT